MYEWSCCVGVAKLETLRCRRWTQDVGSSRMDAYLAKKESWNLETALSVIAHLPLDIAHLLERPEMFIGPNVEAVIRQGWAGQDLFFKING